PASASRRKPMICSSVNRFFIVQFPRRIDWTPDRHVADLRGQGTPIPWFVTLTYAEADAWMPDHVSIATERFRRWCQRNGYGCKYTWVAEIQPGRARRTGKEVVHYHFIAWLPPGVVMPKWDMAQGRRRAFWPHGMTNTQPAKAGIGYLMKYLSKLGEFTEFPKGLRLYGIGGLDAGGRAIRTWLNLPEWAKCSHGVGDIFRKSGRLVVPATGEILSSPYSVSVLPGALLVRAIGPVPERRHCGPYSTLPQRGESAC
ncbi:rolling circle replication-associated protein, partial [Ramlibacter aurantiacus]|uniref:rolling circle replication-associated protein n=1 Tax=Ramlibacter aurantiacus TaxID=2801330 RepID=UPI001F369540